MKFQTSCGGSISVLPSSSHRLETVPFPPLTLAAAAVTDPALTAAAAAASRFHLSLAACIPESGGTMAARYAHALSTRDGLRTSRTAQSRHSTKAKARRKDKLKKEFEHLNRG